LPHYEKHKPNRDFHFLVENTMTYVKLMLDNKFYKHTTEMLLHSQWCSVAAEESVADHTTVPHSIELNCTDQRLIAK